jgi:uncharacterized protein
MPRQLLEKLIFHPAAEGGILMLLIDDLLHLLLEGKIIDVRIGLHWTAVVVEIKGIRRCGLASTLVDTYAHTHDMLVPQAGRLEILPCRELADLIKADGITQRSIGMAAINALLPQYPELWREQNAEEVILKKGMGKKVALVGSFPFIQRVKEQVGELWVLEQNPGAGEFPESEAPHILPAADVVAITGMTVVNHTLEGLLALCAPAAIVVVLGASTPLHPLLFQHGVSFISGSVVDDIDSVLRAISQGANGRQLRRAGLRHITMSQS